MRLTANWRAVLRHAWSVRFIVLAAILSGVEAALPFLDLPVSPGFFALLTLFATGAAFVARLVAQRPLPPADIHWETGDPHEDDH
jgi:hypothetical protein